MQIDPLTPGEVDELRDKLSAVRTTMAGIAERHLPGVAPGRWTTALSLRETDHLLRALDQPEEPI